MTRWTRNSEGTNTRMAYYPLIVLRYSKFIFIIYTLNIHQEFYLISWLWRCVSKTKCILHSRRQVALVRITLIWIERTRKCLVEPAIDLVTKTDCLINYFYFGNFTFYFHRNAYWRKILWVSKYYVALPSPVIFFFVALSSESLLFMLRCFKLPVNYIVTTVYQSNVVTCSSYTKGLL